MTDEEFKAAIAEFKSNHAEEGSLVHAAKGSTWKNHKYIRIENGRYIYPGDEKSSSNATSTALKSLQNSPAAKKAEAEARNEGRKTEQMIKDVREAATDRADKWNDRARAIENGTNTKKQDKELNKAVDKHENLTEELAKRGVTASDYTKKEFDEAAARSKEHEAKQVENTARKEAHEAQYKAQKEAEFKNEVQRLTDSYARSLASTYGNTKEHDKMIKEIGKAQKDLQKKYEENGFSKEEAETKAYEWMIKVGEEAAKWDKSDYNPNTRQVSRQEEGEAKREGHAATEVAKSAAGKAATAVSDAAKDVKKKISGWFKHGEGIEDPKDFYAAVYDYKQSHASSRVPTLEHHGILGQKWGIRRYQNPDGTLTKLGKKRYSKDFYQEVLTNKPERGSVLNNATSREHIANKIDNDFSKEMIELNDKYGRMAKAAKEADDIYDRIWKKSSKEAYDETIKYLNKVDPNYMEEIIRLNNGSTKNLDNFHDFRKTFEGVHDQVIQRYEQESDYKQYSKKYQEFKDAVDDYYNSVGELTSQIIDRYGNKKINGYKLSDEVSGVIKGISTQKYYKR